MKRKLLEELAELEHNQWLSWVRYLRETHPQLTIEDLYRIKWEFNFKLYKDLSEDEKEKDRKWANETLVILKRTIKSEIKDIDKQIARELNIFFKDPLFPQIRIAILETVGKVIDQKLEEWEK